MELISVSKGSQIEIESIKNILQKTLQTIGIEELTNKQSKFKCILSKNISKHQNSLICQILYPNFIYTLNLFISLSFKSNKLIYQTLIHLNKNAYLSPKEFSFFHKELELLNFKNNFIYGKYIYDERNKSIKYIYMLQNYELVMDEKILSKISKSIIIKHTKFIIKQLQNIIQKLQNTFIHQKHSKQSSKEYFALIQYLQDCKNHRLQRHSESKLIEGLPQKLQKNLNVLLVKNNVMNFTGKDLAEMGESVFRSQKEQFKRILNKQPQKGVLQTITKMKKRTQETFVGEGSFGIIYKAVYSFNIELTLHYESVIKNEQKRITKNLARKTQKKQVRGQSESVMNRQISNLLKIRNMQCRFICPYYYNKSQQGVLYSRYIETTLTQQTENMSLNQKIRVLYEIILGLGILHNNRYLHRDIKRNNILCDIQTNIYLIDFGSMCTFYQKGCIRQNLQSTHFVPFKDRPQSLKMIYLYHEQWERHPLFDIYSYGIVLNQLIQIAQKRTQFAFDISLDILFYIYNRCVSENPDQRLTPIEIATLLQLASKQQRNFT